jgi:NADPH2:quinone reductase
MRTLRCHEWGPPEALRLDEVPTPEVGAGQVRVAVHACGLNFPDTLIVRGRYQFKPPFPFAPGGEVAGVVEAVGDGVDRFAPGDRVFGLTGWGGFAEEILLGQDVLTAVPDGMDLDVAAAFTMAYGTTLYALMDRARLARGETLLVLGAAGGVGLAAVEIGKALGARVIAAASTEEKLAVCKEHGADELVRYGGVDLKQAVKGLGGADVVYDPVGGPYAEPALRTMNWDGRYLVIGFAAGEIPAIPLNLVLLKGCSVVGVFWGAFTARDPERNRAHLETLLQWAQAGRLRPRISARYRLEDGARALRDLMDRKVIGKAVVVP